MAKKPLQPKLFLVIALIVIILAAYWYFQNQSIPEPPIVKEPGIEEGDLGAINFVLTYPNGTVVDTNDPELAEQYEIDNYVKGPFRFVVGQSDKVKGFDEAIIGMDIGDERKAIITPSETVLTHKIARTRQVSRNQPFLILTPIKKEKFVNILNREPVLNDVINSPELSWPIKVVNITDNHVVVESLAEEGKQYVLPGFEWKSRLMVKTFNDMLFRHNPEEGQVINNSEFGKAIVNLDPGRINITYQVEVGQTVTYSAPDVISIPYEYQITEVNKDDFTLTRINYLPQETLVLNAELLEWEQNVQKIKWIKEE